MRNFGILGGTFNPIHLGHLIAAQEVLEKMSLDKIIFMPAGNPPHKDTSEIIPAFHRLEMIKLAIKNNSCFELSDIEIRRQGKTYTYDTLMELKTFYSDINFYFIVGFDTLQDMDSWKKTEEVFKLSSFIVVNRGNFQKQMLDEVESKKAKYNASITVIDIPNIDISSTQIRSKVREGKNIKYLVPRETAEYILRENLYRGENNVSL